MGRQRNIHSEEHLKRLQRTHAERPAGFYRKGGKTRPITKPKPKKTRVVKKVVNKPKPVAPTPKPKAKPAATIPGARRGAHGWEFDFPSSSSNKTYTTILWTEDHSQFKAGDISCNCPGWTRRVQPDGSRSCKHTKEVARRKSAAMVASVNQAPVNPVQAHQYGGLGAVRNAASATQAKFEKVIKGSVAGLPGFHIDSTGSIALLADVNESIQDGGDIGEFVKSFPKPADTTYTQIAPSAMGKSVKEAKDPKDSNAIFIGDTTFQKKVVKAALKTLGTENIRVYSMGKDEPVFLVNNDDEAVLLAPYVPDSGSASYDAGLIRLEDVGTEWVEP